MAAVLGSFLQFLRGLGAAAINWLGLGGLLQPAPGAAAPVQVQAVAPAQVGIGPVVIAPNINVAPIMNPNQIINPNPQPALKNPSEEGAAESTNSTSVSVQASGDETDNDSEPRSVVCESLQSPPSEYIPASGGAARVIPVDGQQDGNTSVGQGQQQRANNPIPLVVAKDASSAEAEIRKQVLVAAMGATLNTGLLKAKEDKAKEGKTKEDKTKKDAKK